MSTSNTLQDKNIIIAGATGSMGRAIVTRLAAEGARLSLLGRDKKALEQIQQAYPKNIKYIFIADIGDEEALQKALEAVKAKEENIDIVIYAAGMIHIKEVIHATVKDFDEQYAINLRAPFHITKELLPMIIKAKGHIIYINSSMGIMTKATASQYGATKHGLKAFTDSLRAEVNEKEVRVSSIFPGTTAGMMQEHLHKTGGINYEPAIMSQPEDIANAVLFCLNTPKTSEITDVVIRPFKKKGYNNEK